MTQILDCGLFASVFRKTPENRMNGLENHKSGGFFEFKDKQSYGFFIFRSVFEIITH